MKKILSAASLLVVICTLCASLTGCFLLKPKDKDFSVAGMTITLTDDFSETELVSQTACYTSQKAIVTVLKEEGALVGNYTVGRYAELVCQTNKLDEGKVKVIDDYAEFSYEKELNGKDYYYYARCFKNGSNYWLIQFACETKNTDDFTESFEKWASSITFKN